MFWRWRVVRNELGGPFVPMASFDMLGCYYSTTYGRSSMVPNAGRDSVARAEAHSVCWMLLWHDN